MPSATAIVGSTSGLHARPASTFVRAAAASKASVTLTTASGGTANATSLLSVLALGVRHGDEITVDVTGGGDEEVLSELVALLASDLDAA